MVRVGWFLTIVENAVTASRQKRMGPFPGASVYRDSRETRTPSHRVPFLPFLMVPWRPLSVRELQDSGSDHRAERPAPQEKEVVFVTVDLSL